MKFSAKACLLFLALFMGIFFLIPQVQAAKPIAKVTSFKGQVLIQSGTELVPVMRVGQFLYEGSRIQTKQGRVQVTFNDGAIIKVSPYTNTLIQEREEKSGFWIFKSKKTVRRITAFIGKLWFKSGMSKRKNFLQTPTAVCGIRGSDGDFGFDNQKSYLKMYTGTAEVTGKVTRGRFKNPGKRAANKNSVYRRVERAYVAVAKARATKNPAEIAKAKVAALYVAKEASRVIKVNNPDETVKMIDGEIAGTTADAWIAKEKVAVSVAELKENRRHLQQAIANAKDEKEVKMIEKTLNDTVKAIGIAEKQFVEADRIVREVHDMAARHDMEAIRHAAEAVQKIDGDVRRMYMDMNEDTKNMFKEMGFVPPAPGMYPPSPGQYPPGVRPPGEYPPGMQPPPGWDPSMGPPPGEYGMYPPGEHPPGMYPPGMQPPPGWDPSMGPPLDWDPSKGPPPGEYGMYPPGEYPPGMQPPPGEYGMYPPPGDYPPGEYGMYPPPGDYPPGEYPPEYGMYPPPGDYPPGEYPPEYGMYPPPGDYVDDPYYDPYHDPYHDPVYDSCAGADYCDWNCDGVVDEYERRECDAHGIDSGDNDGFDKCDYNRNGSVDLDELDFCNTHGTGEGNAAVIAACNNILDQYGDVDSALLEACYDLADLNHDHSISPAEATYAQIEDFPFLDKDGNELVTLAEGLEVLDYCDTNHNGLIEPSEANNCSGIPGSYIDHFN